MWGPGGLLAVVTVEIAMPLFGAIWGWGHVLRIRFVRRHVNTLKYAALAVNTFCSQSQPRSLVMLARCEQFTTDTHTNRTGLAATAQPAATLSLRRRHLTQRGRSRRRSRCPTRLPTAAIRGAGLGWRAAGFNTRITYYDFLAGG